MKTMTSNYNTTIMKMIICVMLAFGLIRGSSIDEGSVFPSNPLALETSNTISPETSAARTKLLDLQGFKEGMYSEKDTLIIDPDSVNSEELKELEENFLKGKNDTSPLFPKVKITIGETLEIDGIYQIGIPKTGPFTEGDLPVYLKNMQSLIRLIADKIKPQKLKISNSRRLGMSWDALNAMLQNTETRYCTNSNWDLKKLEVDNSASLGPKESSVHTSMYWCILNSLKIKTLGELILVENIGATSIACEFIRLLQVDTIGVVKLTLTHDAKVIEAPEEYDIMNASSHKLLKNASETNEKKTVETLNISFWPLKRNIGEIWRRAPGPFAPLNEIVINIANIKMPFVVYLALIQNDIKMLPATSFEFQITNPVDFLSIYSEVFGEKSLKYRDEGTKSIKILFQWKNEEKKETRMFLVTPEQRPLNKILQWISTLYPKVTSLSVKEDGTILGSSGYSKKSKISNFYIIAKSSISHSLIYLLATSKITISGLSEDIDLKEIKFELMNSYEYSSGNKNTVMNIEKKRCGAFGVDYTYTYTNNDSN